MTDTRHFTHIHFFRWGFWFRVAGYGLHIQSSKGISPLFSERYGHRKAWYFGGLRFEALKPLPML